MTRVSDPSAVALAYRHKKEWSLNSRGFSGAWLAWSLWALSIALLIGYIPLRAAAHAFASAPATTLSVYTVEQLKMSVLVFSEDILIHAAYVACSTLGALIVARHTGNWIGWIFCAIGLLGTTIGFVGYYAIYTLLVAPGALWGGLAAAWLNSWLWIVWTGLVLVFLPLLYPSGRMTSPRWRFVGGLAVAALAIFAFTKAFDPRPLTNHVEVLNLDNPLAINAGSIMQVFIMVGIISTLLSMVAAAASLILRSRHATGIERQQIKLFAFFAAIAILMFVALPFLHLERRATPILQGYYLAETVAFDGLLIATGLAILKHRLYDIDILINRTLVYVPLTVMLGVIFSIAQQVSSRFLTVFWGQNSAASTVLTTLIIVAVFDPLKKRIERVVDKYANRLPDPVHTVKVFREKVSSRVLQVNTETITQQLLEEAVLGFGATSGAIYLDDEDSLQPLNAKPIHATRNWNGKAQLTIALRSADEGPAHGALVLGPPRAGGDYSERQSALVQEMAQVAVAALEQDQQFVPPRRDAE